MLRLRPCHANVTISILWRLVDWYFCLTTTATEVSEIPCSTLYWTSWCYSDSLHLLYFITSVHYSLVTSSVTVLGSFFLLISLACCISTEINYLWACRFSKAMSRCLATWQAKPLLICMLVSLCHPIFGRPHFPLLNEQVKVKSCYIFPNYKLQCNWHVSSIVKLAFDYHPQAQLKGVIHFVDF